jgi:hypothetical protein
VMTPPASAKGAFDPRRCSVTEGYWAYNRSKKLHYTDQTCPFIDKQVSCQRNGRPDSDYLYWDWHLDDCSLPRSATARVFRFLSCILLLLFLLLLTYCDGLLRSFHYLYGCWIVGYILVKLQQIKQCSFKIKLNSYCNQPV